VKMSMPDVNAEEIPNLNAERERRPFVKDGEREPRGNGNFNGPRGGNGGGYNKSGPPRKKEYGSYNKGESFGGKKPGGKKKFSREMV